MTRCYRRKNTPIGPSRLLHTRQRKQRHQQHQHQKRNNNSYNQSSSSSKQRITTTIDSPSLTYPHASLLQHDDCYYQGPEDEEWGDKDDEENNDRADYYDDHDHQLDDKNTELNTDSDSGEFSPRPGKTRGGKGTSSSAGTSSTFSSSSSGSSSDDEGGDDDDDGGGFFDFDLYGDLHENNDDERSHLSRVSSSSLLGFAQQNKKNRNESARQEKQRHQRTSHKLKLEMKLLKLVLKTLTNLLQSTVSREFFDVDHRQQLIHYLMDLKIGHENQKKKRRKYSFFYYFPEILERKSVIAFYSQMIFDCCPIEKYEPSPGMKRFSLVDGGNENEDSDIQRILGMK
jgi:hypothetical protein